MRFKNIISIGLIIGFIAPLLLLIVFYLLQYQSKLGITEFFYQLIQLNVHIKTLALSVFCTNLILFYIFMKAEFLNVAKGILIATLIYTLIMIAVKFT